MENYTTEEIKEAMILIRQNDALGECLECGVEQGNMSEDQSLEPVAVDYAKEATVQG